MKNFRIIEIFIFLLASLAHAQETSHDVLLQAQAAFASGDYSHAAETYEGFIQTKSIRDGRVYANLGTAYARTGDLGQAAWAYAMAERLAPRDTEIAADAALVFHNQEATQSLSMLERWKRGELPGLSALTRDEAATIAIGLYSLAWIFAFIAFATHSGRLQRLWPGILFFAALWTSLVGPKLYREFAQTRALAVGAPTPVYSSFVGGSEIFTLETGAAVHLIKEETFSVPSSSAEQVEKPPEHWVYLESDDGRKGWVKDAALRVLF